MIFDNYRYKKLKEKSIKTKDMNEFKKIVFKMDAIVKKQKQKEFD